MIRRSSRRLVLRLALCGAAALSLATSAAANPYPNKPVRVVVPFSAGGGTDIIARVVAERLSDRFGRQFVVHNVPGAGGSIGAAQVARAEPDGYTLLVWHIGMISAAQVYKPLPYDTQTAFTPITLLSSATNLLAVNMQLPVKDFKDFVALAKSKPGELNYGSSGIGGADHLAGELLQRVAGISTTHVPYRGGGPATTAAVGGEVQFVTGTASQVMTMLRADRLRPLLVMQKTREPSLPNVPTAVEAGYPDLDYSTWFALWGPAGMPADVVSSLNSAVREVLQRDEVKALLANAGVEPRWNTPQEFDAMFKSEYTRWTKLLADVLPKN